MTNNPPAPSLGLAGCGYWGKNLARNFHSLGVLHSICEPDGELAGNLKRDYPDIAVIDGFESLLNDEKINQVAIATPAKLHFSMAKEALMSGKDVFVEKPICLDVLEAKELVELAEQSGKILMVGHLLQYHPAVRQIQQWVKDGTFGKIFRITSNRLNLGKIRTVENAFWSLAPHDISVVLSLLPECPATSVRSIAAAHIQPGISDWATTVIHFPGNITAQIQSSWLHPFKEQKLSVIGEKAMAVFDDTRDWPNKLTLRRTYLEAPADEGVPLDPEEPLKNECQHFLDCCQSRNQPKSDAREGMRVLQIMEAAQASADNNGEPIKL